MLRNGQLSPNDLAVRQGDKDWRQLGSLFPDFGKIAPVVAVSSAAVAQSAPGKSRKGLLLGCGGFLLVGLLVTAILGFLAYRNLRPSDSLENLPDIVKDMKLDTRYPPKGNIWGTQTEFVGIYSDAAKTQTVIYLMTVYSDEQTAKDALRSELIKSCKTGETPMYFSFLDKMGKEVSNGATCAVPLLVQKGNKLAMIGGTGADVDTFITFAENLPFNIGTTMKKKED